MRSKIFTNLYVDEGKGKIVLHDPFLRIKIVKGRHSKLILNGNLHIIPHLEGNTAVSLLMGEGSTFFQKGDFTIGNGVKIMLSKNAELSIEGRKIESASGITADSIIMVEKKITIGNDFLCAWDVFITDSDWHHIVGQGHQKNVHIGNHVWIANYSSVLKGSTISDGCIVASNSKVSNKEIPPYSLVAGSKGDVIKNNVQWKRDVV